MNDVSSFFKENLKFGRVKLVYFQPRSSFFFEKHRPLLVRLERELSLKDTWIDQGLSGTLWMQPRDIGISSKADAGFSREMTNKAGFHVCKVKLTCI